MFILNVILISLLLLLSGLQLRASSIEKTINKAIHYLEKEQVKRGNPPQTFTGEWGCFVQSRKTLLWLGKKGDLYYDSNCFVTASIHNILAEIYLMGWTHDFIPEMLDLSIENVMMFQNDGTFNFWHELPAPNHLTERHGDMIQRRRSNHFYYPNRLVSDIFNIVNDADDTAAAMRAVKMYNRVCKYSGSEKSMMHEPDKIGRWFSAYTDHGREKPNYYNRLKGHGRNTGAYLTWFGQEHHSKTFRPYTHRRNLPLGYNDIDCVVNTNIMTALAEYGEADQIEKEAIEWLEQMVMEKKCESCGYYYPTRYTFYYSLAKAIRNGVPFSENVVSALFNWLLAFQNNNGSWTCSIEGNELQSTLFALNALMMLGGNSNPSSYGRAIRQGVDYLMDRVIYDDNCCYWEGGIFFSMGFVARKSCVWVSDAYTTALATEALVRYLIENGDSGHLVNYWGEANTINSE